MHRMPPSPYIYIYGLLQRPRLHANMYNMTRCVLNMNNHTEMSLLQGLSLSICIHEN